MISTRIFVRSGLAAFVWLASACSTVPPETRVYETQDLETRILLDKISKPIRITESTVIIDARKTFDHSMAHPMGSVNLSWLEFAVGKPPVPGLLKKDLFTEAVRLARLGLQPNTPVVIVGYGPENSAGDEGRLAWTLLYMGFQDVQIAKVESLGLRYSNVVGSGPDRKNAAIWKPVVVPSLLADVKEVMKAGLSKARSNLHILDVRTSAEYAAKTDDGGRYLVPDFRAVNIPFQEFFTAQGRPNLRILQQLRGIQILPEDRVIVISNNGVRSGAVTFALASMGYKNVANYAGGWTELLRENKKRYRR